MIYHYPHPEWFDGIETPILSQNDTIILWGAGKVGSVVAHTIEKMGLKIEAFVDTARDKQGKFHYGYQIISPDELFLRYPDATVVVSCAFSVVCDILVEHHYKFYLPYFLLMNIDFDGYRDYMTIPFAIRTIENAMRNYAKYYGKGFLIERILLVITDKCSLNCKNCDGYIPYHCNPRSDSLESIIDSYNKVLDVCALVDNVDILGGEPLLHPDLHKLVSYLTNDNRCRKVNIISNGTILPSNELIESLKSSKCTFRISDYGILSNKKEKLIHLFETKSINYEITNYEYWDRIPLIQITNETESQLNAKYSACTTSTLYIKHSKLFQCTFIAGLSDLGDNLIPDFDKNYIDLSSDESNITTTKIKDFIQQLHDRHHLDACKYCPGSHCILFEDKQPVAEQAVGKLPLDQLFKDGVRLCD